MNEISDTDIKAVQKTGWYRSQAFWGVLLAWVASIALALQIRALLNFPAGLDPSFDYALASLFLLIFLMGALMIGRSVIETVFKPLRQRLRYANMAMVVVIILLIVNIGTCLLLFSANSAFLKGYRTIVIDEPRPDNSFLTFPTPANPGPTPTYNPEAAYLSGNIISSLDGFRIGQITLNFSNSFSVINSIQLFIFNIPCVVQQNGQDSTYAVEESKPFIPGPFQVQNQDFFINQEIAVIHGVVASPQDVHGTIYLHFVDPSNGQSCDIGNATWQTSPSP